MYLCYIDESGTATVPGNTPHYILAGLSIPIYQWKNCDSEIIQIKGNYGLTRAEIHTAWLLRKYLEQSRIPDFDRLTYEERRSEVEQRRKANLFHLQRSNKAKQYKQTKKNYQNTESYIHLTYDERRQFIIDVADAISAWDFARIFADCIDKIYWDQSKHEFTPDEEAFEQVVSRFEQFLQLTEGDTTNHGLLIHDNNPTVAKKLTNLMKFFHDAGTLWTKIEKIIETPLFVDSQLTSMVQVADLCAYAMRRYLENDESQLFDLIFKRADRKDGVTVGVRHFSRKSCSCKICVAHKRRF